MTNSNFQMASALFFEPTKCDKTSLNYAKILACHPEDNLGSKGNNLTLEMCQKSFNIRYLVLLNFFGDLRTKAIT